MSRRHARPSPLKQFILWSLLVGTLTVASLALYGYFWLQNYLRSDAIRVMLEARLGTLAQGEARLASLEWSGPAAYISTASLTPGSPTGWTKVEAEGIQAQVDWSGIRQGVWRVPGLNLDWLKIELRDTRPPPPAPAPAPAPVPNAEVTLPETPPSAPRWLQTWIPQRAEVNQVDIGRLEISPPPGGVGITLRETQVTAQPAADAGAWSLTAHGGTLTLPQSPAAFQLDRLNARLDARALTLNHASARWLGDSEVTARGEVPFEPGRGWKLSGVIHRLDLKHLLPPAWHDKLQGTLDADYEADTTGSTARATVANGTMQHLPVLDRIADFTRTDRFRRVVWDEARARVKRQGTHTEIRDLVLQSSGLVRIEGHLDVRGPALEGTLQVGVSTETLRWVPGAQARVFTETRPNGPPGFVWTPVRLTGTTDAPQEDLSNRLLAAMGKELLAVPLGVAGQGLNLLGTTAGEPGKSAAGTGKDVLKTTEEAAGKAVETGVDLLKGMVPLFGK